jgi:16S rRNA processing protein RimM
MADVFSFPTDRYQLIGKVGKPQGLHGEVRLYLSSGQPEEVRSFSRFILVSTEGRRTPPLLISSCRIQGRTAIIRFESVSDRTGAEQLKGMGVLLDREDLPQGNEGTYRYRFGGLPVKTVEGRELGRVEKIFSNGAHDILVIRGGGQEYLIPLLNSIIVRRTDSEVIIAPPPGLLEINSGLADERDD